MLKYGLVLVSVSWFEWWWALWRSRALSHQSVCSSFILGKWITSKCMISHNVSFWLHHLAWNIISTDLEYVNILFSNCINIHLWAVLASFFIRGGCTEIVFKSCSNIKLQGKICGQSILFYFVQKKLQLLFWKDALNWLTVKVKTLIIFLKIYVSINAGFWKKNSQKSLATIQNSWL